MKTLRLSLASILVAGAAAIAVAGPGPQFWQAAGKHAAVTFSTTAPVAVPTGTQRVCAMCAGPAVVTTNDWTNHRGPLTTKPAARAPRPVCTNCCAAPRS